MGNERILLQQWFDEGGTVEDLKVKYGIDTRWGKERSNLACHKYNMLDVEALGTQGHPLVREARGVVLDHADRFALVARSFSRFYNLGEPEADEIDWDTARVLEKRDGSLVQVSWYRNKWLVSSSGTPEASGEVNGFAKTFAQYFWETLDERGYQLPDHDCGVTLIFEITGPLNRVVVDYAEADLVLLGARDLRTQVELTAEDAKSLYMPTAQVVAEYPFKSFAEIAASLPAIDPLQHEGYVVCDAAFRRVKIKAPQYLEIHRMLGGVCPRLLFEIARSGEAGEIEASFPNLRAQIDEYRAKIDDWCDEVELDFHRLKDIPVQKDFAHAALTTLCSSALFAIRAGKVRTAREFLGKVSLDTAMGWLGIRTAG